MFVVVVMFHFPQYQIYLPVVVIIMVNYIVIDVEDHGIGIEEEHLPRVFDRFYHSETIGEDLTDGIGLGLAITNQVIKQHNGKLSVQSEVGKGSTFSVRLRAIKVVF